MASWREPLFKGLAQRDETADRVRELYKEYRGFRLRELQNQRVDVTAAESQAEEAAHAQQLLERDRAYEALEQLLQDRTVELEDRDTEHSELLKKHRALDAQHAELQAQLSSLRAELKTSGCGKAIARSTTCRAPMLPEGQRVLRKIHNAELTCMAAASNQSEPLPSSLLAVGAADSLVFLLDGETGRLHAQVSVSRDTRPRIVDVALASVGAECRLLAADADQALRLLDLRKQKHLFTLRGHKGALSACGFLQKGTQAYSASADRTVKIWDLEKGQIIRSAQVPGPIVAADTNELSGVIVVAASGAGIASWDPRVGDGFEPAGGAGSVVGVRLSPDGLSVLFQTEDGALGLSRLDALQSAPTLSLRGVGLAVAPGRPAFSPDGRQLLAAGAAGLCCWDASTGEELYAHDAPAATSCVCWDLPQAASVHQDGHVALWGPADDVTTEPLK